MPRSITAACAAFALALGVAAGAQAQDSYPSKPVKVLIASEDVVHVVDDQLGGRERRVGAEAREDPPDRVLPTHAVDLEPQARRRRIARV